MKVANRDLTRKKLSIFNRDSSSEVVWAKNDPNVSATSTSAHYGRPIQAYAWYINQSEDCVEEYWCVVASGTVQVIVEED